MFRRAKFDIITSAAKVAEQRLAGGDVIAIEAISHMVFT